jgi:hypothetical protein
MPAAARPAWTKSVIWGTKPPYPAPARVAAFTAATSACPHARMASSTAAQMSPAVTFSQDQTVAVGRSFRAGADPRGSPLRPEGASSSAGSSGASPSPGGDGDPGHPVAGEHEPVDAAAGDGAFADGVDRRVAGPAALVADDDTAALSQRQPAPACQFVAGAYAGDEYDGLGRLVGRPGAVHRDAQT